MVSIQWHRVEPDQYTHGTAAHDHSLLVGNIGRHVANPQYSSTRSNPCMRWKWDKIHPWTWIRKKNSNKCKKMVLILIVAMEITLSMVQEPIIFFVVQRWHSLSLENRYTKEELLAPLVNGWQFDEILKVFHIDIGCTFVHKIDVPIGGNTSKQTLCGK